MTGTVPPLVLEPVVGWPRRAEEGRSYLITVDLRSPQAGEEWPYDDEEFEFTLMLDGAPGFVVETLGEPSVVLHRFGGTYGPGRFLATAGEAGEEGAAESGRCSLWLTISNRWGVPVRKVELSSTIVRPATEPDEVGRAERAPGEPLLARPRPQVPSAARPRQEFSDRHVTVVHTGVSTDWATWTAELLAAQGCSAVSFRWGAYAPEPLAERVDGLLDAPGRVLLLFDEVFFESAPQATAEDWDAVLGALAQEHAARVVAVSVATRPLPAHAAALRPVQVRGVAGHVAALRVLESLGIDPPGTALLSARRVRFPDDPPEVTNAPSRNARFTGRDSLLDQVRALLGRSAEGISRVALVGPAGVGKTQVANEYAHRYANEYDIVWWVSAGFRARAREHVAELAGRLGLEGADGYGLRGLIEAVRVELSGGSRRWLIVLDGAPHPADLGDLLPDGNGHVLITTNRHSWDRYGAELVRVPPFSGEESVAFLHRRAPHLGPDDVDALARAVEDVPLLLDQTAAWLSLHRDEPVDRYIRTLRDGDPRVASLPSADYPQVFQTTWALTLNRLHEESPLAMELLRLFAFFSPDDVPVRLLQTARSAELPRELDEFFSDPGSLNAALNALSEATSMHVEFDTDGHAVATLKSLRMHRLFHQFVRNSLSPYEYERSARTACKVLAGADPREPGHRHSWSRYAALIPHLEAAGAVASADPDVRALVLNCVEYLRVRGEYEEGRVISRIAVDAWRPETAADDPALLVVTHQLANMERRLGNYTDAERIGRDVLARVEAVPEPHSTEVVRAKNGLGGTLMALGRYEEARTLLEEAAAESAEHLGASVPRTLSVRSNLAIAVGLEGRYADAHQMHRDVFEACLRLLGGKHPSTLHAGLHTAWTLRLLGGYAEARPLQEQNCRLHAQVLGPNHSQTLLARHNLALCARRAGDLDEAAEAMRAVGKKLSRRRGPHHPETLMISTDYAMLLRAAGEPDSARGIAEEAWEQYVVLLGESHPYAAGLLGNCALIQGDQGQYEAALIRAERAREGMERALGTGHVWSIGCALNSAAARLAAGDPAGAAELGGDALARARRALGEGHLLTLGLAVLTGADLRAGEALAYDPRALQLLEGQRPYWDFEPQTI